MPSKHCLQHLLYHCGGNCSVPSFKPSNNLIWPIFPFYVFVEVAFAGMDLAVPTIQTLQQN